MAAGEAASDPHIVCECLWTMAVIFVYQGALDKAAEYSQRAMEVGPTPADKAWAQFVLGWALARRSPEASIQLIEPLDPFIRYRAALNATDPAASSEGVMVPWIGFALGEAYGSAGRVDEAVRTLEDTAALSNRCGMKHYEGYAHRLLGDVRLKQGDADALRDAQSHFETALSLFEMCGAEPDIARTYSGLGQVMLREGKTDEAHSYLKRAQETFERLGMLDRVPVR
jgi:tetratricopeptide (TPR) repeat protein